MNSNEKLSQLIESFNKIQNELISILKEKISEKKEYIVEDIKDDNYYTIAYDGGNHPEYASDCFARIEKVYEENNHYYIDTEYGTMDLDYLQFNDMISVWDFICATE